MELHPGEGAEWRADAYRSRQIGGHVNQPLWGMSDASGRCQGVCIEVFRDIVKACFRFLYFSRLPIIYRSSRGASALRAIWNAANSELIVGFSLLAGHAFSHS